MTSASTKSKDIGLESRMPESKGLPLLGDAVRILKDPLKYFDKQIEKLGRVHAAYLGPQRVVFLHDAEAVGQMLWKKGDLYRKPELGMSTVAPLLGQSIATLTDPDRWAEARKFILPLFSRKMLDLYFEQMVQSIGEEVELLDDLTEKKASVDIYSFMHEATFRILIRTIFSRGIEKSEIPQLTQWFNSQTAYINARYVTMNSPLAFAFPAAWRGKADLARLNKRVHRLIDERESEGVTEVRDMLDALLLARHSDGSSLTRKEIRDNCMTLLFGGHETTAGSITWAWGLLSQNPEKRKKLLEEVDRVLGGRPPTLEDFRSLEFTDRAFRETMRLYPMFSMLLRTPVEADELKGFAVEPGDLIAFCAHTIARDPAYWPDPDTFDPERFTKEETARRPKGAYLPFSLGARGCAGEKMARMEGVLILAMLSQHYLFDLENGDLPKPKVSMSIKPDGGMWMNAFRRAEIEPTSVDHNE